MPVCRHQRGLGLAPHSKSAGQSSVTSRFGFAGTRPSQFNDVGPLAKSIHEARREALEQFLVRPIARHEGRENLGMSVYEQLFDRRLSEAIPLHVAAAKV